MTVAALFVEPAGVYADLPGVDLWDEGRDARLYAGPHPVVAHPPCARWCALAPLIESIHGDRYRVGDDGGCFESALVNVRQYGGVLEHPAYSLAWGKFQLPYPPSGGWGSSLWDEGWTTSIDQAAYGHRARKRTWLYAVGCELPELDWSTSDAEAQVSGFQGLPAGTPYAMAETSRVRPKPAASTPLAFRDVLLEMARSSSMVAA